MYSWGVMAFEVMARHTLDKKAAKGENSERNTGCVDMDLNG